jgi:hypothetical protein
MGAVANLAHSGAVTSRTTSGTQLAAMTIFTAQCSANQRICRRRVRGEGLVEGKRPVVERVGGGDLHLVWAAWRALEIEIKSIAEGGEVCRPVSEMRGLWVRWGLRYRIIRHVMT